mmetsp:Transcript_20974/g.67867  ORF Transcript_20974/g.67867 Transcript_20974/m.67867 type:complete len:251 (-) Transcript_20974:902-1654(-)
MSARPMGRVDPPPPLWSGRSLSGRGEPTCEPATEVRASARRSCSSVSRWRLSTCVVSSSDARTMRWSPEKSGNACSNSLAVLFASSRSSEHMFSSLCACASFSSASRCSSVRCASFSERSAVTASVWERLSESLSASACVSSMRFSSVCASERALSRSPSIVSSSSARFSASVAMLLHSRDVLLRTASSAAWRSSVASSRISASAGRGAAARSERRSRAELSEPEGGDCCRSASSAAEASEAVVMDCPRT